MKDRIPTPGLEGRLLITPEDGSPAFYAKAAMADNPTEQGTPFATATMLTDETAALFGLDGSAVPNDVLRILSGALVETDGRVTHLDGTLAGVQISVGTYEGTDTYGSANPNTLTFDFVPKLVIVSYDFTAITTGKVTGFGLQPEDGYWSNSFIWFWGQTQTSVGGTSSDAHVNFTLDGKTLSWYNTKKAEHQLNANYTYRYIAIG